jgi:hypothetical protein
MPSIVKRLPGQLLIGTPTPTTTFPTSVLLDGTEHAIVASGNGSLVALPGSMSSGKVFIAIDASAAAALIASGGLTNQIIQWQLEYRMNLSCVKEMRISLGTPWETAPS